MTRQKHSTHKIEDLLAQCDFSQPRSAEDEAWLNMPDVGAEILPPYDPEAKINELLAKHAPLLNDLADR